jgi:uncharacterized damage-inducible protein DinB
VEEPQLADQLVDAWNIHNRIQLYLLDAIAPEALRGAPAAKGRSVGSMFAHIHNIRLVRIEFGDPALAVGLTKIEKDEAEDKELLRRALHDSGIAVAALLQKGLQTGKIKNFKPHPAAFAAYLIAHEAYHQGEIGIVLNQAGHKLDREIAYGMWDWDKR